MVQIVTPRRRYFSSPSRELKPNQRIETLENNVFYLKEALDIYLPLTYFLAETATTEQKRRVAALLKEHYRNEPQKNAELLTLALEMLEPQEL